MVSKFIILILNLCMASPMGQWSVHVSRGDRLSTHTSAGREAWWAACRPSRGPGHVVLCPRPFLAPPRVGRLGLGPRARLLATVAAAVAAVMEQQIAHAFPQPFPATPTQILCRSSGSNFVSKLHKIKVHA